MVQVCGRVGIPVWAVGRVLSFGLVASGCISPTTTLQTARTIDPGHVEVAAGASLPVHTAWVRTSGSLLETAFERAKRADDRPLTDAEERQLREAALAILVLQPSWTPELDARIGLLQRIDVGIRYAGASLKFDLKYNFLRRDTHDLALTVGYVHHTGIGQSAAEGIYEVLEFVDLVEYSRQDLDVALLLSGDQRAIFSAYGAIRYIAGFTRFETQIPEEWLDEGVAQRKTSTTLHYIGPTAGMRLGTKRVAFLAELTLMWLVFEPTLLGKPLDLSGLLISPALGLQVRF